MPITESHKNRIPGAALATGLGGLIPFWFLSLSPLIIRDFPPVIALFAINTYGAVILSFVGAIWWGLAVAIPNAPRTMMFSWSVVPALLGWVAAVPYMPADLGLLILMAGFALQWILDIVLFPRIAIDVWVLKLRTILTLGVLASLVCAWWILV